MREYRHNYEPREERLPLPTRAVTDLAEIRAYFDFADPHLHIEDHELLGESYAPESIARDIQENRRTLLFLEKDGIRVAGGMGTLVDVDRKKLLGISKDKKTLVLEYLVINEAERGKGYEKDLTDARIQWGKEHGADTVATEVEMNNFHSLVTKLKQGFAIRSVEYLPEEPPYYVLSRRIDTPHNERDNGELTEVRANDTKTIEAMLDDGWIGIDIKNTGEVTSTDPAAWVLILEK